MAKIRGLYLRGSIYWFSFQKAGKRSFVSLQTSDLSTAITRAANFKRAEIIQSTGLENSIAKFIDYKKCTGQYGRKSLEWSESALKIFCKFADYPATVRERDVAAWYADLRVRLAETSAQSYLRALRSFCSWMLGRNMLAVNPFATFKLPRIAQPARLRFCSKEERDRIIGNALELAYGGAGADAVAGAGNDADAVAGDGAEEAKEGLRPHTNDTNETHRTDETYEALCFIYYCGFHAGMRKNEIIEARPDWFDLEAGLIHITNTATFTTKGRRLRTIPMTRELRAFVQGYGLRAPFMLKPGVRHGRAVYRYDFELPFVTHVKSEAVGLPWVTAHVMRHTFAALLVSSGVSLFKVAKWLGDSLRVTEDHYAHLVAQDEDIERSH